MQDNEGQSLSVRLKPGDRTKLDREAGEANMPLSVFVRNRLGLSNVKRAPTVEVETKVPKDAVQVLPPEVQRRAEGKKKLDPGRLKQKTRQVEATRGLGPRKAEGEARKVLERGDA